MSREDYFVEYHLNSAEAGDIDPGYGLMLYLCDRFELNEEQRYWLAFLYATSYCAATTFYIYNEFPDFENVDPGRLERWWKEHRADLFFQTDRRWVRSRNQWCDVVASYRGWVGSGRTQAERFGDFLVEGDPLETYRRAFRASGELYQFGRFALFLYLEAVHVVTGYPMEPDELDLANAESSRNGLCYALALDELLGAGGSAQAPRLNKELWRLIARLREERPDLRHDVWNVETSLCAFHKHMRDGSRWIGYYIARQGKEILSLEAANTKGVCWDVLWDYRAIAFGKQRGEL